MDYWIGCLANATSDLKRAGIKEMVATNPALKLRVEGHIRRAEEAQEEEDMLEHKVDRYYRRSSSSSGSDGEVTLVKGEEQDKNYIIID